MLLYQTGPCFAYPFRTSISGHLDRAGGKSYEEYMADDIKKIIEEATGQIREDIKGVGIQVEAVQSDVQHIAEAVDSHTDQLGRLEAMPETLSQVKTDVEAMKVTLVDLVGLRHMVADLQKRVEDLEAKAK